MRLTTLARDCSNFSVAFTPDLLAQWQAADVGLVIVQAFPQGYAQYAIQLVQMSVCQAAGMPFDAYIYDYLDTPSWRDDCLSGLSASGFVPRKLWLDEEDQSPGTIAMSTGARIAAISASLMAADVWLVARGRPNAGVYSGRWWWTNPDRVNNTTAFSGRDLWDANYSGGADTTVGFVSYGGWTVDQVRIKQYAGTQPDGTDLDVLSAEEETELTQPTVDPCAEMSAQRDSLVNALGYIGGDLLGPVAKLKSPTKAVRTLIAGIRSVCDQMGINHA